MITQQASYIHLSEFTRRVLARVAPEEIAAFDLARRQYLRDARRGDPAAVTAAARCRDDPMGIGIEIDVQSLLAGVVAYTCTAVAQEIAAAAVGQARATAGSWVRRILGRRGVRRISGGQRTETELGEIHKMATEKAMECGVDENQARLIAEAIIEELRGDDS